MVKEEEDVEEKVRKFEQELKWLEAKFYRSGVDPTVRLKTLLRMQKRTNDFLLWFVRRYVGKAQERAKEAEK